MLASTTPINPEYFWSFSGPTYRYPRKSQIPFGNLNLFLKNIDKLFQMSIQLGYVQAHIPNAMLDERVGYKYFK